MLIPPFGPAGAAAATLTSLCVATVLATFVGSSPVRWDYGRYASAIFLSLMCALWISNLEFASVPLAIAVNLSWDSGVAAALGVLFWQRPLIIGRAVASLLRRRFGEAAALFADPEVAA